MHDRCDPHAQRRPARRRSCRNRSPSPARRRWWTCRTARACSVCSSDEVLAALPASRGYGNLLAVVLGHSVQRHSERRRQPGDDLLHVARRPQQRGHRADRRHERRLGVQRRRRGGLRLRHRQRPGSAAHRGGRARRGRPRRAAVQHRAQDRRQHLQRHLLRQPGRDRGRRATTWTTSCSRSASPPHQDHPELGYQLLDGRADQAGPGVVLRVDAHAR